MTKTLTLEQARANLADARRALIEAETVLERVKALRAAALVSPAAAVGLSPDQLHKEEQDATIRVNSAKGTAQRAARQLADVLRAELTQASLEAGDETRELTRQMDVLGERCRAARQRSKAASWSLYSLDRFAGQAAHDPVHGSGPLLGVSVPN